LMGKEKRTRRKEGRKKGNKEGWKNEIRVTDAKLHATEDNKLKSKPEIEKQYGG